MDGLLLHQAVLELDAKLAGGRVDRVLQPEREEIHLLIRTHEGTQRLLISASADQARVHLSAAPKTNPQEPPVFCMLLRKLLGGSRVAAVRQVGMDRICEIDFDCIDELGDRTRRTLTCELMGRHSNLVLRSADGRILDSVRHVGADVNRVREIRPGIPYLPPPSQEKLDPLTASAEEIAQALTACGGSLEKALGRSLEGLSAETASELALRLTGSSGPVPVPDDCNDLARRLKAFLDRALEGPPVVAEDSGREPREVFAFPQLHLPQEVQKRFPGGVSEALDHLYSRRGQRSRLEQTAASLLRVLQAQREKCEKKLAIHLEEMNNGEKAEEARICGELLTANLYRIRRGEEKAVVDNYYDPLGGRKTIALDVRLSPGQNAQRYYKKYQKLNEARKHARQQSELIRAELDFAEDQADDVRKCRSVEELEEIRGLLLRRGMIRDTHRHGRPRRSAPTKLPEARSSEGVCIRYGRNADQNERVTASAAPDDLWLHAKDMPGSHVVIAAGGNPVGDRTLLEAATLAAYFSKGFRSTQVPVDVTRRRYVRKPASAAAGRMIYTHQETYFIRPDEAAVRALIGEEAMPVRD